MKKLSVVLALSTLLLSASTFAAPSGARQGLSAAYHMHRQIVSEVNNGLLDRVAKRGLDIMVAQGVATLREVGENQLADQYEHEWKDGMSLYLTQALNGGFGTLELGDFDPLSIWLANFYDTLSKKTMGIIKGIRIVSDINKLNYALGVVLRPNASWRLHTSYDRIEYRKHFIPFANIMTYWATLEVCKYYAADYSMLCDRAAGMLEHYMGRYLAPRISDRVFKLITHERNSTPAHPVDLISEDDFQNQVLGGNEELILESPLSVDGE